MPTFGCTHCKEVAMTTANLVAVTADDRPRYFYGLAERRETAATAWGDRRRKDIGPIEKSLPGADIEGDGTVPNGHEMTREPHPGAFGAGYGLCDGHSNY